VLIAACPMLHSTIMNHSLNLLARH
jgi:hypothetical protein